jgi:hypothetical protein
MFPSSFGTGSEDYFGGAWGLSDLFVRPYHGNVTRVGPPVSENSVYRYHISDSIPFQKSFDGSIEKYLPDDRVEYAAVVYWYLSGDGGDTYGPLPISDRNDYWRKAGIDPRIGDERHPFPLDTNLIEGEEMGIDWNHAGVTMDRNLSGGAALTFAAAQIGDRTSPTFNVVRAGKYLVSMQFRRGPEGGIYQVSLAGRKLGNPVDLYAAEKLLKGPAPLGAVDLAAGYQALTLTCVGKNPASKSQHPEVCLDYFRLIAVSDN